jgi:hypothetical protein
VKLLKLQEIVVPETRQGMHDYKCADGTLILFDQKQGVAYNVRYLGYMDCLCEHVDKTDIVESKPKLHKKYLDELQNELDSWGTEEDERSIDAAKELVYGG